MKTDLTIHYLQEVVAAGIPHVDHLRHQGAAIHSLLELLQGGRAPDLRMRCCLHRRHQSRLFLSERYRQYFAGGNIHWRPP